MRRFETRDETLNEDDEQLEYRRRRDDEKTCVSYGQRKLLLSLVSFLSKFTKNFISPLILYIGAAPGNNIALAIDLFPNFEWHLYDPARFSITTDVRRNVFVYQKYFDNETAKYWAERRKDRHLIFISDIRTADYTKAKDLNENEDNIELDMRMQRTWVEILRPDVTQLKFRLSYVLDEREKEYEYFDGVIYKQCFAPQTSTETRLVFSDIRLKNYDCEKYERQLFFHNAVTREKTKFLNEEADGIELVDDWDCSCEVNIWKDYLIFLGKEVTKEEILTLSTEATKLLNVNKKQADTLSYLRSNPRIIKNRNFNRTKK